MNLGTRKKKLKLKGRGRDETIRKEYNIKNINGTRKERKKKKRPI